ncbi:DUF4817 domain-containing protein [Trichonephila clavipes]|nr:DUF4817 domain-containing protein [Trichonephila clavipes]
MKSTTLQSMVIGRAMITNFFIPELNNHDVQELWFQQDGATCHTARATIDLLKDTFGDRLISRFGPVNWPPRSCDLTPLDYFLWGYVKSFVYAVKPQTLDHLEDNNHRVIADIRPQMLEKVIENWTSRLDCIRASRGSPMPEIIFKMERKIILLFITHLLFVTLASACPGLELVIRSQWNARAPSQRWYFVSTPVEHVIIGHTATAPCLSQESCAAQMRSMQNYHMELEKTTGLFYRTLFPLVKVEDDPATVEKECARLH